MRLFRNIILRYVCKILKIRILIGGFEGVAGAGFFFTENGLKVEAACNVQQIFDGAMQKISDLDPLKTGILPQKSGHLQSAHTQRFCAALPSNRLLNHD